MPMKSSVFVRIDRYREIYDMVTEIRSKLEDAKQVLKRITDIKSQEDTELKEWQNELMTADQKLTEITRALSER